MADLSPGCHQAGGAPQHIAVIPDGNRRWAKHHNASLARAYDEGAARAVELVRWCDERAIHFVTIWTLSVDNLGRPADEIANILDAVLSGLRKIAQTGRWRIRPIGDLELLPDAAGKALARIAADTADNSPGTYNVALAYSGRRDIVKAAYTALVEMGDAAYQDAIAGPGLKAAEQLLGQRLSTAGQPDVDLVIRTSGEQRLSGFMPWQSAYSELHFTPVGWPDFTEDQFDRALDAYRRRQPRNGL